MTGQKLALVQWLRICKFMFKETEDRMELQLGVGMCSLIIKTCTFKELECQ